MQAVRKRIENTVRILVNKIQRAGKFVESTLQGVRRSLLLSLEEEAAEIVALEQSVGVVDTTSEVGQVDTSVSVDTVDVTAQVEGLGVSGLADDQILKDVDGVILVSGWAAVPVVGDALLALLPEKVGIVAGDTEPGLEHVAIKVAIGFFCGVVGHLQLTSLAPIFSQNGERPGTYKVDDEVIGSRSYDCG